MTRRCAFCAIVAGDEPAEQYREFGGVVMFEPLNPVTPNHMLVVPKRHVEDLAADPATTADVMTIAARYCKYGDFNVITSKGATATQTVFHLHIHVVPRRPGDGLALPWRPA